MSEERLRQELEAARADVEELRGWLYQALVSRAAWRFAAGVRGAVGDGRSADYGLRLLEDQFPPEPVSYELGALIDAALDGREPGA